MIDVVIGLSARSIALPKLLFAIFRLPLPRLPHPSTARVTIRGSSAVAGVHLVLLHDAGNA
jgi:hypothetical protein